MKPCAVLLLVLVLSPFTAPFQTFFTHGMRDHVGAMLSSSDTAADDALDDAVVVRARKIQPVVAAVTFTSARPALQPIASFFVGPHVGTPPASRTGAIVLRI